MSIFKFRKSKSKKVEQSDEKEPSHLPIEEKGPVTKAATKVTKEKPKKKKESKVEAIKVTKEKPKKSKAPKKQETKKAVKKSKLEGLSPAQKAKVPFQELDPKDPLEFKEIIRRRNMGFN